MNKIKLIIRREYLSRVRKRSFIIMSVLGPVLFAAMLIVPTYLANMGDKEEKKIAVIDESMIMTSYDMDGNQVSSIPDRDYMKFVSLKDTSLDMIRKNFAETGYYAVLYIPSNIFNSEKVILYSDQQPSLEVTNYIRDVMEQQIEDMKLVANNIENLDQILKEIKTSINVSSIKWTRDGEAKKSRTELIMGIGYASGFLIYMFIFMYGSMVMRGVIEEKTSRVVEVIVSSVKPFQLMMGKIIGVGLVGLTQFLLWVILTIILATGASYALGTQPSVNQAPMDIQGTELFGNQPAQETLNTTENELELDFLSEIFDSFESVPVVKIVISFLFFFVFGFLIYGSLFAIVGSAVDSETDTQQFMLPITIPLILAIFVMLNAFQNPNSSIAFWFSMIPFTSPVVMMARIPFGLPAWELGVSLLLLVITFILTTWMAGKIYRTGILMYGKKVSYRELWKWLRYKN